MKKTYIIPELRVEFMQTEDILVLSLQNGKADNSDALAREDDDNWSVWEDEDEEE